MVNLLLDSSNTYLSVGLMQDDSLLDYTSYESWQSQSEHMVPEIDSLLKKHGLNRNDLSAVVVAIGPGSYTGVRIALCIAKVIALALNIPIYPVSSLRVLKDNDKPSICLINARSGRSYFAVYRGNEVIEQDQILTNEEVVKYINEHPDYSICGQVKYLGYDVFDTNVCLQMVSLFPHLNRLDDALGLKPVYMKD